MSIKYAARVIIVCLVGGMIIAGFALKPVRWRDAVLISKLKGEIPEIPLRQLILWLRPASPVELWRLAKDPSVYNSIKNEDYSDMAARSGAQLYARHCARCHGPSAQGGIGPNLLERLRNGLSDWDFLSAVKWGRPGTGMLAQPLSDNQVWQVHSFVRKALQDNLNSQPKRITTQPAPGVTFEDILGAAKHSLSSEWLTFAGDYSGRRHTFLSSINKNNVRNLRMEWVAQLRSAGEPLEASPIVHNESIYVTESPDGLVALDARTGARRWHFRRPLVMGVPRYYGSFNRGVAILGNLVFLQTLDSHLVAIDSETGKERWDVKVAEYKDSYTMSGAPLALRDKLIVGVGGGDYGSRGFISAYRAQDGQRLWTFNTIPGPGEVGHEAWKGGSWELGGAGSWATGAYDPATGTVFWGVGNPALGFVDDRHQGDYLYSNSVVALDENTGTLKWYFQFTPKDEHDWDSAQQPVLGEIPWHGVRQKVVLWANRNGFFYALDRNTGQFLLAEPFVKQNWNAGFLENGRPIVREESRPSKKGSLVWPWSGGATNWNPPSYDPKRQLLYVPTVDSGEVFVHKPPAYEARKDFVHDLPVPGENVETRGEFLQRDQTATIAIKAIDARNGKIRWETALAHGTFWPYRWISGILSTSSGLVFTGIQDEFLVLDADTGNILRRFRVGGTVVGPPISYGLAGRQYIAVLAGNALFTFALP
jgi:alcohol dehydrogenase (cytochrome c)